MPMVDVRSMRDIQEKETPSWVERLSFSGGEEYSAALLRQRKQMYRTGRPEPTGRGIPILEGYL